MWEIANTIDQLPPNTNLECPICYEHIDMNEILGGVPNCKVCVNNHRWHSYCPTMKQYGPAICPICRSNDVKFCKFRDGYMYNKKGGKKNRSKYKSRKYRKNKSHKKSKRKSYKKYY
jgi:hypothetical protein